MVSFMTWNFPVIKANTWPGVIKMSDRILRLKDVREKSGLSESGLKRAETVGEFPKRIKIGPRAVGWSEKQVDQWIADRIAGGVR
jgi:prophage regulatory protein